MKQKKINAAVLFLSIGLLIFLFSYFRIKPIHLQSVAYTYDQGRDFLKAAEIVLYKNPTFIGPTTGIMGIFHGAWWYYLLTIPFMLFKGSTIGFYYFNFGIHFITFAGFIYFLRKYFGTPIAFTIGLLISISPYFISSSIFVGNNIMVLPSILTFLVGNFMLLEKYPKSIKWQICLFAFLGISLGLISEFEFAFGLLLMPIYFLITLIFKSLRTRYFNKVNFLSFLIGLTFIFSPRILFELKNNFSQTRTLFSFFIKPKHFNPKPYMDILSDRLDLFINYFSHTFSDNPTLIAASIILALLMVAIIRRCKISYRDSLVFYLFLLFGLFIISTLYKDNFWANYYEGLPYLFIMILAIALKSFYFKKLIGKLILILFMVVLLSSGVKQFLNSINSSTSLNGLRIQQNVVDYIISNTNTHEEYCVKVYTPPVIPYTYDYLFLYHEISNSGMKPSVDFKNNKCWYILETDQYAERKEAWLESNLPQDGILIYEKLFPDIDLQLWKLTYENN